MITAFAIWLIMLATIMLAKDGYLRMLLLDAIDQRAYLARYFAAVSIALFARSPASTLEARLARVH